MFLFFFLFLSSCSFFSLVNSKTKDVVQSFHSFSPLSSLYY
nr:MAG TPA: hypothetical protein [Caudoviricetes sp.]